MEHSIFRPMWETALLTAWQDQLVPAVQTPWLPQTAMPHGNALLPRFAAWYKQLHALPRRLRRALQRKLALPLAGLALLLALGQPPSQAATIMVDGTTCTLVDAITAANTDTAQGSCSAGSGADTLVLAPPGHTVTLTRVDNTTQGPTGLPVVSSPITIAGQGGTIARAPSAPAFRLVAVNGTGNLTLQDVTLTGGASSTGGGGVYNRGTVTLTHSTITGNTANMHGGGVANISGTVTLTHSTISSNTASSDGGGVYNDTGAVTLIHSTITGNTARIGGGGGVFSFALYGSATVTLTHSTITGNTARFSGGGVANHSSDRYCGETSASVTLAHSTITGNTARGGSGGGVANSAYCASASVTLIHSTITGNTARGGSGGGAANSANYATATLTLAGSLITGNLAPTAPEIEGSQGDVRADAFNLFGFSGTAGVTGFTPGRTDLVPDVPVTAILDPVLADHGGPTLTHALVPGSPALDAIPWGTHGCGTTVFSDQRGQARPQPAGGACDIGAYEVGVAGQPVGAWVVGLAPETVVCTNLTTGQTVPLSEPASAWDCEAAGLSVRAGEQVAMGVRGTVETGATDVGGAVTGLQPQSARCTNLTTGAQVPFQLMRGATAGSCVTAGLAIQPGDRLQLRVQGTAE